MAKSSDVLADDAVQQIQLYGGCKLAVADAIISFRLFGCLWLLAGSSLNCDNDKQRAYENFFQVGKAKAFGDIPDSLAQLRRKFDELVLRKL